MSISRANQIERSKSEATRSRASPSCAAEGRCSSMSYDWNFGDPNTTGSGATVRQEGRPSQTKV